MSTVLMSGLIFLAVVVMVAIIGASLFLKYYLRATKDRAFVRTGTGGERVVVDGGAFVIPAFHQMQEVNMKTLRLPVSRKHEASLITKNKLRIDVTAEFYVRVKTDIESIAIAAQTLGDATLNTEELSSQIEGKFIDGLRSVAAKMTMDELHENRVEFIAAVQKTVSLGLEKNGLELEDVSLTSLDQTPKEFFMADNAFDAEGLTILTKTTSEKQKIRNDIEQNTALEIAQKNMQTQKEQLIVKRETEYATIENNREIENRRSEQDAEIAKVKAENKRASEMAEIVAEKETQFERIRTEEEVEKAIIAKERALEEERIQKLKKVQLAEQSSAIEISLRSEEQSQAEEKANKAKASAAASEELIITAREKEVANRAKDIEIIDATREAEKGAVSIKVQAEAEKEAAANRAEAITVEAKSKADAELLLVESSKARYAADAEGEKLLNDARNLLNSEQTAASIKKHMIEHLSEIIKQSVKPMENISDIKIVQMDGLNGVGGGAGCTASEAGLPDQLVNSALKYRSHAPLLDSLMTDLGFNGGSLEGLTKGLGLEYGMTKEHADSALSKGVGLSRKAGEKQAINNIPVEAN